MPPTLLPASAAAFAPRTAPTVVLPTRAEQWLKDTLKGISRVNRRPLNSAPQISRYLAETLAGTAAAWLLAAFIIPKAPASQLLQDENPMVAALANGKMVHIEAYIVHIDMVSQHEVAFKLAPTTIATLIDYYKNIYLVDCAATSWDWPEKAAQLRKLQEDFVQAINSYVFRTDEHVLEGILDDYGAGELLEGRSDKVKTDIVNLFHQLVAPQQPPMAEMIGPVSFMTTPSSSAQQWWPAPNQMLAPGQGWQQQQMLGSSPSPMSPGSIGWSPADHRRSHAASPASSYSQSYSTPTQYCSPPTSMSTLQLMPQLGPYVQQCGIAMTPDYANCGWSFSDMMPQYTIQI
jgi:hypothetical protein